MGGGDPDTAILKIQGRESRNKIRVWGGKGRKFKQVHSEGNRNPLQITGTLDK